MTSDSSNIKEKAQEKGAPESMQQLLDEADTYKSSQYGDILDGVIMQIGDDGVLVNVGQKSEGMLPHREMRSLRSEETNRLQVGEKVTVFVVRPESGEEPLLLSIDRAQGEKGWHNLQKHWDNGETISGVASSFNRGGLLVEVEGIRGFVPLSHLMVGAHRDGNDSEGNEWLAQMVGKEFNLKIIELNRERNRVILSEKVAYAEWREKQKEKLLEELHQGDIRQGRVTGICSFGAFVDLGGADGLVHLSEFSWEPTTSPEDFVKVGDEVEVYVLKVDIENKKIALSFRRVHPEPWEEIVRNYHVGQLITAEVTKLTDFGAFARLEGCVEGLIHLSELADEPIQHPGDVVREGEPVTLKILRIDSERRRIGLSLKQAKEEAVSEEKQLVSEAVSSEELPPIEVALDTEPSD